MFILTLGFGGRLYPLTTSGQMVTMIYSFVGIPLMLAMTSDLGLVVFDCEWFPSFLLHQFPVYIQLFYIFVVSHNV